MSEDRLITIIQNLTEMVRAGGSYSYDDEFLQLLEDGAGITKEELLQLEIYSED